MLKTDSLANEQASGATAPSTQPQRKPLRKRLLMWVRRGHLYFGLFLFPWAVLYGVTAFLFNHPTAFSDQPTATFSQGDLSGTPLETPCDPQAMADDVLAQLNALQKPTTPYHMAGPAKFGGRDFAFATVKADGQTINILIDVKNGGGTVRSTPIRERQEPEKAPFATGRRIPTGPRSGRSDPPRDDGRSEGIQLAQPLHERIKASIPTILERTGFPTTGEITVTSVPDVVFPVTVDHRTWTASYNAMTGSVSGTTAETKPETELSVRRFLLRLHTAHGYPNELNGRWFWAIIVDVMAFTMCFWGLSGLLMWWQIKATRQLGFALLSISALAATALGIIMHTAMTS